VSSSNAPTSPGTGASRREQLLVAAEALILERGLRALTVDEVTVRAGVAKGTFYLYFRAKREVLDALRERYVQRLCDRHAAALATLPQSDHRARLDRWVAEAIRGHLEHERLHDMLFHDDTPDLAIKTGVTPRNPQIDLLARELRAGVEAGAFHVADPETTAALVYGARHPAVDLRLGGGRSVDVDRIVAATQRLARAAAAAG